MVANQHWTVVVSKVSRLMSCSSLLKMVGSVASWPAEGTVRTDSDSPAVFGFPFDIRWLHATVSICFLRCLATRHRIWSKSSLFLDALLKIWHGLHVRILRDHHWKILHSPLTCDNGRLLPRLQRYVRQTRKQIYQNFVLEQWAHDIVLIVAGFLQVAKPEATVSVARAPRLSGGEYRSVNLASSPRVVGNFSWKRRLA